MKQPARHGSRKRYQKGCHCEDCVAANNTYINDYNARRRAGAIEDAVDSELDCIAGADVPFPGPWADRGACRDTKVDFFVDGRGPLADAAKAICARCPVKVICREYAIPHSTLSGIWGGTTTTERTRIRQGRKADVA